MKRMRKESSRNSVKKSSKSKISVVVKKDMTIGEAVQKYPESAEVMLRYGLHCVGCHVNPFETIEMGAKGHGIADNVIEKMVKEINDKISKRPQKFANSIKNGSIAITKNATSMIKILLKKEKKNKTYGLRIEVLPGGCSGFTYNLSFDNKKRKDDLVTQKEGLKIFIDRLSIAQLSGSTLDFVETENGSGFKIDNPNIYNYSCQ